MCRDQPYFILQLTITAEYMSIDKTVGEKPRSTVKSSSMSKIRKAKAKNKQTNKQKKDPRRRSLPRPNSGGGDGGRGYSPIYHFRCGKVYRTQALRSALRSLPKAREGRWVWDNILCFFIRTFFIRTLRLKLTQILRTY